MDLVREQGSSDALETRIGGGSSSSEEVMTKLNTLDGNINHRSVVELHLPQCELHTNISLQVNDGKLFKTYFLQSSYAFYFQTSFGH